MLFESIIFGSIRLLSHRTFVRGYVLKETESMIQRKLAKKAMKSRNHQILSLNHAELIVVGSDHPPHQLTSLLVRSGQKSYLFNCGEGFQRSCSGAHIKINQVEHLFLTNNIWPRLSGAVGFFLTAQEGGLTNLTLHGNDRIEGFLDAIEPFTPNSGVVTVKERSYKNGSITDDGNIKIETIPLDSQSTRSNYTSSSDESGFSSSKRSKLEPNILVYYCQLPNVAGKLDAEKCRELKVPFGPLLATLKAGQDVHLEDGTLVRSEDVVSKSKSGCGFIVIECPTVSTINYVINNKRLEELRSLKSAELEGDNRVDYVFHFTPEQVYKNYMYQDWMNRFSDVCRHIMLSHNEPKRINLIDIYRHQHAVRALDDVIFPELYLPDNLSQLVEKDSQQAKEPKARELLVTESMDDLPRVTYATSFDHFCLRPTKKLQYPDRTLDLEYYLNEGRAWDENLGNVIKRLRDAQRELPKPEAHEPEVVFLGTCSAKPSKTRNVSGILINFSHRGNSSVILDCGEGTYGQLVRFYGPDRVKDILKQLKLIFVSHHHADHHLGLLTLLEHRADVTSEQIPIVVPKDLRLLLDYHSKKFNDISNTFKVYDPTSLTVASRGNLEQQRGFMAKLAEEVCRETHGLVNMIKTVPVDHCVNAFAVVLTFNVGHKSMRDWTVAYSGDCRPSNDLVYVGKNCDLLIHEATYNDKDYNFAQFNKHCTSSEAITVGKNMNAKFTILTHFSVRSTKMPSTTDDFDDSVGIAFDLMAIKCPTHLQRLPLMRPALLNLFGRYVFETAEATAKREMNSKKNQYYKL